MIPGLLSSLAKKIFHRFSPEPVPNSSSRGRHANAWLGNEDEYRGRASSVCSTEHPGTAGTSALAAEGGSERTTASTASAHGALTGTRLRPAAVGADGRPSKAARQATGDLSVSLGVARIARGERGGEVHSWDLPTAQRRQTSAATAPATMPLTPAAASAASLRSIPIPTTAPRGSSLRYRTALHPNTLLRPWQDADGRGGGGGGSSGSGTSSLRAVAAGWTSAGSSAATPRTPVRRWSSSRGDTEARASSGVVGGSEVGGPRGYACGMPVLPQSTPRRLIMATAHSARVRSTVVGGEGTSEIEGVTTPRPSNLTGTFSALVDRRRSGGDGGKRLGSSPPRSPTVTVGGVGGGRGYTGLVKFKSHAARKKRHAQFLSQFRREQRMVMGAAAAAAAVRPRGDPQEVMAVRSLNTLRSKARQTLERDAHDMEGNNPIGAERLRKDARCIENWGREAEEGAKREAAERALRLSHALFQKEAEQATARKRAIAGAQAAKEAAEAATRTQMAEARARAEEGAKLAASAAEAAAAAATAAAAAAAVVQDRPKLSKEQVERVQEAWSSPVGGADDDEVVVRAFNDMVSKGSLRTLRSGEWLGDEVINLYMKIIQARNKEAVANGEEVPKCGIMSSFFYTQLSDNGRGYRYQGVKRFLKKAKLDLFDLDKFIFPVNVNQNHWTLAVINFRLQRLEYYDSLGSTFGDAGFEYMARFVDDESKAKRSGQPMDISDWPRINYVDVPRQKNGIDCGVFASMFADRLSKGRPLSFSQGDIGHCRKVMTLAILRGERPPTEAEAFLEDGGQVPLSAPVWWEPPPEDAGGGGGVEDYFEEHGEDEEGADEREELGDGETWRDGAGAFDLTSDAVEWDDEGRSRLDHDPNRGGIHDETANEVDLTSEGEIVEEEEDEGADGQETFYLNSDGMDEFGAGIFSACDGRRDEDESRCVSAPLQWHTRHAAEEGVKRHGIDHTGVDEEPEEEVEEEEEENEEVEGNGEEEEGDEWNGDEQGEEIETEDEESHNTPEKEMVTEELREELDIRAEQEEQEEGRSVLNGVMGQRGRSDTSAASAESGGNDFGGGAWPGALPPPAQHHHAKKYHVKKQFLNRERNV